MTSIAVPPTALQATTATLTLEVEEFWSEDLASPDEVEEGTGWNECWIVNVAELEAEDTISACVDENTLEGM